MKWEDVPPPLPEGGLQEPDPDEEEASPTSKTDFSPPEENLTTREVVLVLEMPAAKVTAVGGEVEVVVVPVPPTVLGAPFAISLKTRRKHFCRHSEQTMFMYWSIINCPSAFDRKAPATRKHRARD